MQDRPLKQDVQALYAAVEHTDDLDAVLDGVLAVFSRHPEELRRVTGAFRLTNTEDARCWGFRLRQGEYAPLPLEAEADVCVLGKTDALLRVFKRQLSPVKALLTGKIKVVGQKKLLVQLAEFL